MVTRIAVLGCGHWGKNLARNFHALGALELVCDPAVEGRATASQIAPGIPVSAKFEEALSNSGIDAVVIAAPAAFHYSLAKAALEAGKDVLVEKPLCLDEKEGEELVRLADRLGRVLMVGHLLQYHPCVRALQSLVASGELGKLQYITSTRLNLGKIRREENALWSFAPHDISVILSLTGGQPPEQVRCTGGDYLNQGIADATLTAMRFQNGVRAHVFVSWLNPFKEQKLTVVGSSGLAVFDDTRPWAEKLTIYRQHITWMDGQVPTPNKIKGEPVVPPQSEPLSEECQHFLDCCRGRYKPRTDGREGLLVLALLQAAQRSLDADGEAAMPRPVLQQQPGKEEAMADLTRSASGGAASAPASDYFVHPRALEDLVATRPHHPLGEGRTCPDARRLPEASPQRLSSRPQGWRFQRRDLRHPPLRSHSAIVIRNAPPNAAALAKITEARSCPTRSPACRRAFCARPKPRVSSASPAARLRSTAPTAPGRSTARSAGASSTRSTI